MPFDAALNATQLGYLRGSDSVPRTYRTAVYLSAVPNATVYSARVNQTSFDYPLPELAYDGGVGTLADVQPGMTVLISHTNDKAAAFFRGRVRKTPTASLLYINESGDEGLADDDYIFVINDYQIREILPRDVAGSPKPDWDVDFRPLKPIISGLRSVYADFVKASTGGKLQISFAPTVVWAASGSAANASTPYSWDIPSGGTITVGASTDKDITVRFDAGFEDWVSFTAMDDNDTAHTFRFHVWAHDKGDNSPIILAWTDLNIECEIPLAVNEGGSSGYNGSLTAFAGVSGLLDETLVCAWCDQFYNGTDVDLGSAGNILLTGRLQREQNQTAYEDNGQQNKQASLEIAGPLAQLELLRFIPMWIEAAASASDWNQIEDLTLWRVAWLLLSEYSTFGGLHSLDFDDVTDTFLFGSLNTQGGDLLYTNADLFQSITAVLQADAAGMCEMARRGSLLSSADRAGLVTVADFDNRDQRGPVLSRDHPPTIGVLKGAGGSYRSATGYLSAYDVVAPNGAPGRAAGEGQLYRQILVADQDTGDQRAELEQRAGDAYAAQQTPETLTFDLPPAYHWLTPDVAQWLTWTLAASETVRGKTYDTNTHWWLSRIRKSYQFDEQGQVTIQVTGTFVIETTGAPGGIIDYPPPDVGEYPATPGDIGDLPTPTPTEAISATPDISGATSNCGSYAPGTGWEHDCCDSLSAIDIEIPLGDIITLQSLSITYTADTTVSSPANAIYVKILGRPWQPVSVWTTESGSNQTRTVELGGVPATHVRIVLYGSSDCGGTITLTSFSYTALDYLQSETLTISSLDGTGEDTSFPLETGITYRFKVSGFYYYVGGSGGNQADALYYSLGPSDSYNTRRDSIMVDGVQQGEGEYLSIEFNPGHVYEFDYVGAGSVVTVAVWDDNYGGNFGDLTVEIRRL